MSDLAKKASVIMGVRIEPGHWAEALDRLDILGYPTRKQINSLVFMLLDHIEKLEAAYDANKPKPEAKTPLQSPHP